MAGEKIIIFYFTQRPKKHYKLSGYLEEIEFIGHYILARINNFYIQ